MFAHLRLQTPASIQTPMMASRKHGSEADLAFLLECIKHGNLKVDFDEVAETYEYKKGAGSAQVTRISGDTFHLAIPI